MRRLIYVLTPLLLALLAGGVFFYRAQYRQTWQDTERDLAAVSHLKLAALEKWRQDVFDDAEQVADKPALQEALPSGQTTLTAARSNAIHAALSFFLRHQHYDSIRLVDASGRVLVQAGSRGGELSGPERAALQEALHQNRPVLSGADARPRGASPHLAVVAPARGVVRGSPVPGHAVILGIDPRQFLCPLLGLWPMPSGSAETVLAQRTGNQALILNDLRFGTNTAMRLEIPFAHTNVSCVKAALGQTGMCTAVDYRGVPVLAALARVPGTPWVMSTEVDLSEVFAGWHRQAALFVVLGVLLLGGILLIASIAWLREQRNAFARLFRAEAQERKALQSLQESEARYRQMADNIQEVFWLASADLLEMLYVSPAYTTIWGRTCQSLYDNPHSWIEAIHPEDRARVRQVFVEQRAVRDQVHQEYRIVRPDGSVRWIEDFGFVIRGADGQALRMTGVATDITRRKEAELELQQAKTQLEKTNLLLEQRVQERTRQLAESEERLRVAARNADIGTFRYDFPTGSVQCTPEYKALFGVAAGAELSLDADLLPPNVLPVDRPAVLAAVRAACDPAAAGRFYCEHRVGLPDGTIRWVRIAGLTEFADGPQGRQPVRASGAALDITAAKQTEESVHLLNERLEQRVLERTRDLQRSNRALQMISTCNRRILQARTEPELLQEICRIVIEVGGYWMAWIGLAETDESHRVRPVAQAGFEAGYLDTVKISWDDVPNGRGPTGIAIRTGRPVVAQNLLEDPKFAPWREEARKRGYAASIALPLTIDGQTIGALMCYATEPQSFDDEEAGLLAELADSLSYGIQVLRARATRERTEAELAHYREHLEELVQQRTTALQQSESKLRSLFAAMTDVIFVLDREGRYLEIAPTNPALLYRPAPEVIGKTMHELFPAERAAFFLEHVQRTLETRQPQTMEYQFEIAGRPVCFAASVAPLDADRVMFVARDITSRRQAEEALRASEARYRALFNSGNDAIFLRSLESAAFPAPFLDANEAACTWLGYSREELLRMSPRELGVDVEDAWVASINSRLLAGERVVFEVTLLARDGRRIPVEVSSSAFTLEGARFGLEIMRDVTERKQHERDLHEAKVAADAANRAKSTFLANMSHEIRTPLNAILGYAQLLRRDAALPEPAREKLRIISRSGDHLLALINDVLEMAKIEAGRLTLAPAAFDLGELLADLASMFRQRAEAKGLQLRLVRGAGLPRQVVGDARRLRQILVNLCGNAIKFTERGWIEVRVGCRTDADGKFWLDFDVEDTGVGISQAARQRLFSPFEQSRDGHRREGGTGLGLAISREYARLMGGDITVSSAEGKGSVFHVATPMQIAGEADRPGHVRQVTGLAPGQPSPRVLVVDDNRSNRDWLVALLRDMRFEVREADGGAAAVRVWAEWKPQLVLMDLRMPDMDGFEATRRIRQSPGGNDTVVIALTASALGVDLQKVHAAGAADVLGKPFEINELLERIARFLGVRFCYAEDAPSGPAGPAAPAAAGAAPRLDQLPPAVLRELRAAVASGDQARIERAIQPVEALDSDTAAWLRTQAASYEYDRLNRLLPPEVQR